MTGSLLDRILALLKGGGAAPWLLVMLGAAGVAVGFAAVGLSRRREGAPVGLAALAVAVVIGALSVAGETGARARVDAAIAVVDPVYAGELRAAGYAEAHTVAELGVLAALVPLAGGLFASLAGARRRAHAALGPAHVPRTQRMVPGAKTDGTSLGATSIILGGLAVFALGASALPLVRGATADAGGERVLGAREAQALLGEGRVLEGCTRLEAAYRAGGPSAAEVPDRDGLVRECFEQLFERATSLPSEAERKAALAALGDSPLPWTDDMWKRLDEARSAP